MSFFMDAGGSSEAGIRFFRDFLDDNKLGSDYRQILENPEIDSRQVLFLFQRLFYYDRAAVREMMGQLSRNNYELYNEYSSRLGDVSFFIRSARKYRPWTVVFMYDTNIQTSPAGKQDINYPLYQMAAPAREARNSESAAAEDLFIIDHLDSVETEILLVAGTLDQVALVSELKRIHRLLPNSKLVVFEAYHCLQASDESRNCRNRLANLFFRSNPDDSALKNYLKPGNNTCKFIKLFE